ncbi:uncharacterized protein MELLADRAFT_104604 [Melampsora larici-populina 98AG31]|uniref:Uncharacterized protein n=1 Tax=Melampsora larici-populina (strain 98AG31 / pathotype 3-4-7) TaxID=747676 RepID=F4RF96_MELLP|nr:uncharacterized protein MELLADRAFT_104604 [Melampsora larici-populina 98AG31]EGG08775.1 hypothetical protein MELLADRAFT_104604 [Melampsora larici-populina 98AG31]
MTLVHCDSFTIGYPQLTGSPPICGPCCANRPSSSTVQPPFPRPSMCPPDTQATNYTSLTQSHLETMYPPDTQAANLAGELESSDWGRRRQLSSSEAKKLFIATAPFKLAHTQGVKTHYTTVNLLEHNWTSGFAREAWADISTFAQRMIFSSYISLGIGKDHMSHDQVQEHVNVMANRRSHQGPTPKYVITPIFTPVIYLQTATQHEVDVITAYTMGLTLENYLLEKQYLDEKQEIQKDSGKKYKTVSESSSLYDDDDEFDRVQDALWLSLEDTGAPPYVLRSHTSSCLSAMSHNPKSTSWWCDPTNEALALWGSKTDLVDNRAVEVLVVNQPVVQDILFLAGFFGSDLRSAGQKIPDLCFLGGIAIPISTTWANSTRVPLWKNMILLVMHVWTVTKESEISFDAPADGGTMFRSLQQAGISIKPWQASFFADKGNPLPSSALESWCGGQVYFDGSLINVVARQRLKGAALLQYLEEFQMNFQASKLLVAGYPGVPKPLAALIKTFELHYIDFSALVIVFLGGQALHSCKDTYSMALDIHSPQCALSEFG